MKLIDAGIVSPERSVELDKEVFNNGEELLMIYSRDRPAVSLGKFSSMDSVDMNFAEKNGIAIVRRISGGSMIYSDEKQITITYIATREMFPDKTESYRHFGTCIVNALRGLEINAEYKPINDVLLKGGKISGSAQYRNDRTVLVHGSLILGLNEENLKVLKPLKKSLHPVTSIEKECGFIPGRKELYEALVHAFSE